MKKLLILLFSLFLLSSTAVFADDISDFQIEGMSIGDSLLNYMTKEEILEEIELNKDGYSYLKKPNKYVEVYKWNNLKIYNDGLSFFVKNNPRSPYITNKNENEKFIILGINGLINYIEDFDSCMVKRDEIIKDLSKNFPYIEKVEYSKVHRADPSGNSFLEAVYFDFDSGARIELQCNNFEETIRVKKNWSEGLNVSIVTKEILDWFLK